MLDPANLHFQKLQFSDLPLIHQWLNTPSVTEWYSGEPTTLEGINEVYGPYIDGREPNQSFLIMYDTTPIGYIQTYKIRDYPEWYEELQPTEEAAGLDIFIGHADYIHRGLGSFVVKKFMQEIVFSQPEIESCILDVDPNNKVVLRTYQKAGFIYWKTIWDKQSSSEQAAMKITKAEFLALETTGL